MRDSQDVRLQGVAPSSFADSRRPWAAPTDARASLASGSDPGRFTQRVSDAQAHPGGDLYV